MSEYNFVEAKFLYGARRIVCTLLIPNLKNEGALAMIFVEFKATLMSAFLKVGLLFLPVKTSPKLSELQAPSKPS